MPSVPGKQKKSFLPVKVRYVQLKPSPETVLKKLPWKGRKHFYLLFTLSDGSTRTFNIGQVDIRRDPRTAAAVARKVLLKVQSDLALNTFKLTDYFPSLKSVTLQDFFEYYFRARQSQVDRGEISPNTFRADQDAARQFQKILGHSVQLGEITSRQIHAFIEHILNAKTDRGKNPFSKHSINIYLRTLSSAFGFAVKNQFIENNPFAEIQQLKTERIPRHLQDFEVDALREYLQSRPLWQQHFFEFNLATGLRAEEMFTARLDHLKTEIVHGIPAHFLQVLGKGRRLRWVPCDDAIDIIRQRNELVNDEIELRKYLSGLSIPDLEKTLERGRSKFLFFEIASYYSVSQFLRRARRACHLSEDISPHSLRHTFAVRFLEQDRGDIYTLSQILGHTSVKTTEIYLSATPRLLRLRGKI